MANNLFKVKLRSQVTNLVVAFDVTPEITETRNVTYKTLEPVHLPGGIHVYGNTSSRIFNINNVRLVSRTREEASKNLYRLNLIRSWTMPYFGVNNSELTGAPPDVLALSAYATGPTDTANSFFPNDSNAADPTERGIDQQNANAFRRTRATNIHNIPVVMQQYSAPYPSDTDYVVTAQREFNDGTIIQAGVPFPAVMTVDMVFMETHSPREFSRFDLKSYRQGLLDNF